MKKIIILFLIFQAYLLSAAPGEGISFFEGTFDAALASAKKQNKLLFIDCYTTWCGPCKWMAEHVFTNDTVFKYFSKQFICYKMDMEKGEGVIVSKKYAVKNYPTFLCLDGNGKQVHRSVDSAEPSSFMRIANNASQPSRNLSYLEGQYKAGVKTPSFLLAYAHALKDAYDTKYQTVADEYFRTQPVAELSKENNWKTIIEFTPNVNSYVYETILKSPQPFYERYGKDSVQHVLDQLALESLQFAGQKRDSVLFEKAVDLLKQSRNEETMIKTAQGELSYYKSTKNMTKYTTSASTYIPSYFWNDAKTLNAICWTYFMQVIDKAKLANAEQWIKRSVELEDAYYNTDTYANILHKMGKKKEAADMARHSIEQAKKSGEGYESTEELLNTIIKEDSTHR